MPAELTNEPDWVKEDNNSKLDESKSNSDKVKVSGRARKPRRSKGKSSKKESDSNGITAGKTTTLQLY